MKLYEQLLLILDQLGVGQIFGVPGDAINPLIEALRNQDKLRFIHVAHEETGAFAASTQAKLSGHLAVCAGTVGPGAIHLINGLYDAKKDHVPVLAITGQVPSVELGFGYHQEVDLDALFKDVAVYQKSIHDPDQMPRIALEACNMAISRKGVAVLTIPQDIGKQSVPDTKIILPDLEDLHASPHDEDLNKAVDMIDKARNVAILYGEGCRDCAEDLIDLARHLSAPMVYSLRAKDVVPYDHELVAGGLGLLGTRGGVKAFDECDLLLTLGSDFPYRNWYPQNIPVVQVDINPAALGRRVGNTHGLAGDCKKVIPILRERTAQKKNDDYLDSVRTIKKLWDKGMDYLSGTARSKHTIHPQALARTISESAREDAIITCDTGAVTVWGARHFHIREGQRFLCSFNLASMAYAMPASIGAQLKYPERQVISLSGDGGFNMLMGDLLTAVKYETPVKVFIFNNRKLGLIKMEQEVEGYPEYETDLLNPDYRKLAESFGVQSACVKHPDELRTAVEATLSSTGPYLLDVHVYPDELTIPPRIDLSQAWGFAKSRFEEAYNHLFGDN